MFPGHDDNFGGPFGPGDGPFMGGGMAGQPPSADSLFERMSDDPDELFGIDAAPPELQRDERFLSVGLHFFERMKRL